LIVDNNNTNNF